MIAINSKHYSKIALFLLGFSSFVWNANPANAILRSVNLNNEDFTIDPSGLGSNNAAGNSTINITSTPNGFGSTFNISDTFLLLGASDVNSTINGAPTNSTQSNTNVRATYSSLDITQANIDNGLNFAFNWAFQGTDDTLDSFLIGLAPQGTGVNGIESYIFIQGNYDSNQTVNQNVDLSGLTSGPGSYDFIVSLSEADGPGNSAAGFDNIVVSPANVPFEVSPTMGFLILGGLYGGSSYLKRRKSAAKIDFK